MRKGKRNRRNEANGQRCKDEMTLAKEEKQEQVKTIIRKCNAKSYNKLWCHLGLRLHDLLSIDY